MARSGAATPMALQWDPDATMTVAQLNDSAKELLRSGELCVFKKVEGNRIFAGRIVAGEGGNRRKNNL